MTDLKKDFRIVKCSEENFLERFSGDMTRDYEMLTPQEWLNIYGD